MSGTLFLVPTGLGGSNLAAVLPEGTREVVARLEHFIAEDAKSARAFLKAAGYPRALQSARIDVLDENTPRERISDLLEPLVAGIDCGLMSEAGAPAVADPGALLVRAAHAEGVRVVPLVGPSALLLALMGCGLNGQRFAFGGYLPIERGARVKRLKLLERRSEENDETQAFIEAPYRNDALMSSIMENCQDDTLICLATDLTLESERLETRSVAQWKKSRPAIDRRPTVFLLYREAAPQKR